MACFLPNCEEIARNYCGGCHYATYCCRNHQKEHWPSHGKTCASLPTPFAIAFSPCCWMRDSEVVPLDLARRETPRGTWARHSCHDPIAYIRKFNGGRPKVNGEVYIQLLLIFMRGPRLRGFSICYGTAAARRHIGRLHSALKRSSVPVVGMESAAPFYYHIGSCQFSVALDDLHLSGVFLFGPDQRGRYLGLGGQCALRLTLEEWAQLHLEIVANGARSWLELHPEPAAPEAHERRLRRAEWSLVRMICSAAQPIPWVLKSLVDEGCAAGERVAPWRDQPDRSHKRFSK